MTQNTTHLFKRIKQCTTSFSQSLLMTSHIGVLGTDHENTSPASKDIATFLPAKCIFLKPNPANIIMYIVATGTKLISQHIYF